MLLKEILALLEVIVLAPVKLTAPGKERVFAPETVILFPIWMELVLVKVRFVKGFVPPTTPLNAAVPTVNVRAWVPFRVLLKVIFVFSVLITLAPFRKTGLGNVSAPETVILFPIWI